jgi:hypothetical protein
MRANRFAERRIIRDDANGTDRDRTLAWVSLAGCIVQIGFAVSFGSLVANVLDFRPLATAIIALVLAAFSLRSARQNPARLRPLH